MFKKIEDNIICLQETYIKEKDIKCLIYTNLGKKIISAGTKKKRNGFVLNGVISSEVDWGSREK